MKQGYNATFRSSQASRVVRRGQPYVIRQRPDQTPESVFSFHIQLSVIMSLGGHVMLLQEQEIQWQ